MGPGNRVERDLELGPASPHQTGSRLDLWPLELVPRPAAAPAPEPDVHRVGAGIECRRYRLGTAAGCEENGHRGISWEGFRLPQPARGPSARPRSSAAIAASRGQDLVDSAVRPAGLRAARDDVNPPLE